MGTGPLAAREPGGRVPSMMRTLRHDALCLTDCSSFCWATVIVECCNARGRSADGRIVMSRHLVRSGGVQRYVTESKIKPILAIPCLSGSSLTSIIRSRRNASRLSLIGFKLSSVSRLFRMRRESVLEEEAIATCPWSGNDLSVERVAVANLPTQFGEFKIAGYRA